MGFHSDTFLDLRPGSKIGVVSLGAAREMVMQKKVGGGEQRLELTHNSLMLLDEQTNAKWRHGIQKKRAQVDGPRVAIVFRESTTFRSEDGCIFGARCEHATLEEARAAREHASSPEEEVKAAAKQERINRMCELKNVREWDGEAMAKFLSGSTE